MLFRFKHQPSDFIVREIIDVSPDPKGKIRYINIEKTNQNTMDVIVQFCKNTGLTRSQIGLSGLKDKKAITSQRISISLDDICKGTQTDHLVGQDYYRNILGKLGCTIRGELYANDMLKVGSHSGNTFQIKLRAKRKIQQELKSEIEARIEHIRVHGFPNCYGQQRFGKNNFEKAKEVLESGQIEGYQLKLKLQAYPNIYFNTLALQRYQSGHIYVDGDICIKKESNGYICGIYNKHDNCIYIYDVTQKIYKSDHSYTYTHKTTPRKKIDITQRTPRIWPATGLMMGTDMLVCNNDTPAHIYDAQQIQESKIINYMKVAQAYKLTSYRRPLTTYPSNLEYTRDGDDLEICFGLGVGSYATVLLGWIFGEIDEMTCVQNKWRILSV